MTYRGPLSDHFDGKSFYNLEKTHKTLRSFLAWQLRRKPGIWPTWVEHPQFPVPPARVAADKVQVTYINHACVLWQTAGLNVLTDPIWSKRCSPLNWLGPKRVHKPGLSFAELPPIDLVLISHDHYDHLDIPSLKELHRRFKPVFISGLGTQALLQKHKLSCIELDWWQEVNVAPEVQVCFVPARHWSARGLNDTNKRLWGGFVLTTPQHKLYYSGDTAMGKHFKLIQQRFQDLSLAVLPIGAYEPTWFMQGVHMTPLQAVQAYQQLNARYGLGIHFNTFAYLADEAYDQPLHDLASAKSQLNISSQQFTTLLPGESWIIS